MRVVSPTAHFLTTGRKVVGLLLFSLCLMLQGCQGGSTDAALEQYLARLGRALGETVPVVHPAPAPLPPRPGELRQPAPPGALDALDFLALTGCAVQVTIGRRNSSLGRMAPASQRLLLELEYLQLAPDCVAFQRAQGRGELADTLQAAWQAKRDQLPALIFNATLGGDEYRRFWRTSIPAGDYPAATGSQVIDALQAINSLAARWLSGDYRADNMQFEIFLGEVATGDGGALLEALSRQGAWLSAADSMLARRQRRGPLCSPGVRHDAADILPNVVRRFFVGQVQPQSAALGSRYHQLLPPVRELEALLADSLPLAFTAWRSRREALLEQLTTAPRHHVEQLQLIMAPCGGMVAPP